MDDLEIYTYRGGSEVLERYIDNNNYFLCLLLLVEKEVSEIESRFLKEVVIYK